LFLIIIEVGSSKIGPTFYFYFKFKFERLIYYIGNQLFNTEDFKLSTIQECLAYCNSKKVLGLDTETSGLNFLYDNLLMFQIGDKENQFIIDCRVQNLELLRPVLESREILKILSNGVFDYKFIKSKCKIDLEYIWDTQITDEVLYTGRKKYDKKTGKGMQFSLAAQLRRHLGVDISKEVRRSFIGLRTQPFTVDQIKYGAGDIDKLIQLKEKQEELVDGAGLRNVVELENEVVLVYGDMEYSGITVDKQAWLACEAKAKPLIDKAEASLNEIFYSDPIFKNLAYQTRYQLDIFSTVEEDAKVKVNWGSNKQVLEIMKIIPGLKATVKVNKDFYTNNSDKHELVKRFGEYKEKYSYITTFGKKWLKNVWADGKVHTSLLQIKETGRSGSKTPNMQQIPVKEDVGGMYRNCFLPPKGYKWVSSDYSSQELCIIAVKSGDEIFNKCLREGKDLHSVCAQLVFKDKWKNAADENCAYYKLDEKGAPQQFKCKCKGHKSQRQKIKTLNYGLAYGLGAEGLARRENISIIEAREIISEYFKTFSSIESFLSTLGNFGKTNGYIRTFAPYERIRLFEYWKGDLTSSTDMGSIERASKNQPIQGSSADMVKLALVNTRRYIKDNKLPVLQLLAVHDAQDTAAREDFAEEWSIKLTEIMEDAAKVILPSGLLKADTTIDDYWSK